jgi:hypothetical protein
MAGSLKNRRSHKSQNPIYETYKTYGTLLVPKVLTYIGCGTFETKRYGGKFLSPSRQLTPARRASESSVHSPSQPFTPGDPVMRYNVCSSLLTPVHDVALNGAREVVARSKATRFNASPEKKGRNLFLEKSGARLGWRCPWIS